MMKELDFERVHNMEKGIIGWEKSGYPLMKWVFFNNGFSRSQSFSSLWMPSLGT
jgi:hypothetical protein